MDFRTAKFFHGYAADFDAIYGTSGGLVNGIVNRLFRKSVRTRFIKTLDGCHPIEGKDVLDVGCGPGHYSVALARMGARSVLGVDFAESMLDIARERATREGVLGICRFEKADFPQHEFSQQFDYVIVMGFMDYMEEPNAIVRQVLALARGKAFFSFPVAGGLLAWQRQLRYRNRCALFLYTRDKIQQLFSGIRGVDVSIEQIDRDFFVTAVKN